MTQSHQSNRKTPQPPELYGLVLAGGHSRRMGQDKGLMVWYDKPQLYYAADLLAQFCSQVYLSCRPDQVAAIDPGYELLVDTETDAGQFGAIQLALMTQPGKAWLVVACDLPLLDAAALAYLIDQRDGTRLATAFSGSEGLPEPLAAIWEPAAARRLAALRTAGVTCPRKALIRSANRVKLVSPPQPYTTMNVNTPAAAAAARGLLNERRQESGR